MPPYCDDEPQAPPGWLGFGLLTVAFMVGFALGVLLGAHP
jgi:hypothetical protein